MLLDQVLVIYKTDSKNANIEALSLVKQLESQNIGVTLITSILKDEDFQNLIKSLKKVPDLGIVLGGDGTVLKAAHNLAKYDIPILSFNVGGNLGFLSHDRKILDKLDIVANIKTDKFLLESRMMIEARIKRNSTHNKSPASQTKITSKDQYFLALNDFYIKSYRDEISPTCILNLEINSESVDEYKGDGLILATPTGSTAYAMASGGSILHPDLEAIIISPICPMSLSSRPVVVPALSKLTIKPRGVNTRRVKLWQDGRGVALLDTGDECLVQRAAVSAKVMLLKDSPSYYKILAQKLNWAGSLNERKDKDE